MSQEKSLPLLEELWAHANRAEFTCRYPLDSEYHWYLGQLCNPALRTQ